MLLVFGAPGQLRSLAGQEHGRTILLVVIAFKQKFGRPLANQTLEFEMMSKALGLLGPEYRAYIHWLRCSNSSSCCT